LISRDELIEDLYIGLREPSKVHQKGFCHIFYKPGRYSEW